MTPTIKENTRQKKFRKILLAKRAETIKLAQGDLKAAISGEGTSADVGDEMDQAQDSSILHLRGNLTASRRRAILKIDEALLRLNSGEYGICVECGDDIPEKRLLAYPFALRCVDCQEEVERREKHEGGRIDNSVA